MELIYNHRIDTLIIFKYDYWRSYKPLEVMYNPPIQLSDLETKSDSCWKFWKLFSESIELNYIYLTDNWKDKLIISNDQIPSRLSFVQHFFENVVILENSILKVLRLVNPKVSSVFNYGRILVNLMPWYFVNSRYQKYYWYTPYLVTMNFKKKRRKKFKKAFSLKLQRNSFFFSNSKLCYAFSGLFYDYSNFRLGSLGNYNAFYRKLSERKIRNWSKKKYNLIQTLQLKKKKLESYLSVIKIKSRFDKIVLLYIRLLCFNLMKLLPISSHKFKLMLFKALKRLFLRTYKQMIFNLYFKNYLAVQLKKIYFRNVTKRKQNKNTYNKKKIRIRSKIKYKYHSKKKYSSNSYTYKPHKIKTRTYKIKIRTHKIKIRTHKIKAKKFSFKS